ncbi:MULTISPECIES: universal stress protein [Archaeoglobus]|jgi:nucleotide-binding universal stress UspA family protein|uniref:UspA domain-containing protein n=3 Tax=Archaeoglobus fulgidus TaxID=2234 RepID=O28746_ARCFU|nr:MULTISPECIES: universal stress protein [Archaeoglobus]AAB89722.1 conserved hypothetical protein [Archaeoglobus fulgidus DSM 4304]AIG98537.1 Universal stress protein UspA [Archaeoglobus fulgidus DSM 8774]KUJ94206.1 MAG: hypothetical protein XD40_0578 [Archaeoglobus fulgidus]KUK06717.1 MAG: hypothetical protein XD48_1047 [Archaeoglobus fulgidus]MDI3496787.1 hypothetical protein [Archaeoglobus sp.]
MERILLVLDDTGRGEIAFQKLKKLAEDGLRGEVYILYIREMEVPPFVPEEKELAAYHRLMTQSMKKLEGFKNQLEKAGLKVSDVSVVFGKYADRLLLVEKQIKPDLIVVGFKGGLLKRVIGGFFGKDPCEVLLKKSKASLLICRG